MIATKIANGRDKDYKDVSNLIEKAKEVGRQLDQRRIKENLKSIKDHARRERALRDVRSFLSDAAAVAR